MAELAFIAGNGSDPAVVGTSTGLVAGEYSQPLENATGSGDRLTAGIAAIGVSTLISVGFVYTTLLLWRLDYGKNLNTPFYSFLTGRDYGNEDD